MPPAPSIREGREREKGEALSWLFAALNSKVETCGLIDRCLAGEKNESSGLKVSDNRKV